MNQRKQKPQRRSKKMKLPKGITEEEVIEAVDYVFKIVGPRFRFALVEIEDLRQQSYFESFKDINGFDASKSKKGTTQEKLRAFLYRHIYNRLFNFKRNNLGRTEAKQAVTRPLSIDNINDYDESGMRRDSEVMNEVYMSEVRVIIEEGLSPELYKDYQRMVNELSVPPTRRQKVEEAIRELLKDVYEC
jgi:hypothetical protein